MVRHTLKQIGREARRFRRKHGEGAHLPASLRKAAALFAASDDAENVETIKDADFFKGATSDEFVFARILR